MDELLRVVSGPSVDLQACRNILVKVFEEALKDSKKDEIVKVPKIVESAGKILFESKTQAFREALIGCALARLHDDEIDITKPYMNQGDDAFNGRTLDERVVNPFLQENEIPQIEQKWPEFYPDLDLVRRY